MAVTPRYSPATPSRRSVARTACSTEACSYEAGQTGGAGRQLRLAERLGLCTRAHALLPTNSTRLLPRVRQRLHAGLDRVHREHGHVLADAGRRASHHVLRGTK